VFSLTVTGKVVAMCMLILVLFAMTFEHCVVDSFLLPSALLMGGKFSNMDCLICRTCGVPKLLAAAAAASARR
jgi:formate transporter